MNIIKYALIISVILGALFGQQAEANDEAGKPFLPSQKPLSEDKINQMLAEGEKPFIPARYVDPNISEADIKQMLKKLQDLHWEQEGRKRWKMLGICPPYRKTVFYGHPISYSGFNSYYMSCLKKE